MRFALRTAIAILALAASVFLAESAQALILPGTVESSNYTSEGGEKAVHVLISGGIAHPLADKLKDVLKAIPAASKITLELSSPGGTVDEGNKIIQLLEDEIKLGRKIETFVQNGSQCGSMCVPIFMVAKVRKAGEVATFMFHPATTVGLNVNKQLTGFLLGAMILRGLSEKWISEKTKLGVFSSPGEYWMTGKELSDEKAGVVTELKSRHIKYKFEELPFDPNLRSR